VSLGDGGSLTLQFTDNFLNGDGTSRADLFVIEVGVAEGSTLEVSPNGSVWTLLGEIPGDADVDDCTTRFGSTCYGFDVDAFGFGITDTLTFVRITDLGLEATSNPPGSDIDAVGAIQTVIPVPAAVWLFGSALGLLGWVRRRQA
jgi:hypothetical protein